MAVVHPVDRDSLLGAIEAAQAGLIVPTWSGRRNVSARLPTRTTSISPAASLSGPSTATQRPRPRWRWRAAVKVDALMKGSLHTDELMHAVVAHESGLTPTAE